ncbi:hypothetical protein [Trichococcus paludicola]|uniref:hypothetical protein n=1 Tax=Trichococcus paludicola TaxID=2052942 RepID=UPI000D3D1B75|nr:hypothetical protein [Trichococcus paludicola]
MNCCKNNKPEEKNLPTESVDQQNIHDRNDAKASKHSHKKHFLHLALCCGLPLLLLFVLPLIGYQGILLSIAPLICPIMMFVMMPMMMKGHDRKEK